jgi:hypothetical protein
MRRLPLLVLLVGCAAVLPPTTSGEAFGVEHAGSYHLGPVDFAQSRWPNACAPYPAEVQRLSGVYLAGVDRSLNGDGRLCDACALITTGAGKSLLVRIVTTGVSKAPGDMDLSPEAFEALGAASSRPMGWRLAKCPANGPIHLQYQAQANVDWTSFWVRNARLPVDLVEVQSARHPDFTSLRRGSDGTWNLDRGFGRGAFTLRLTSVEGKRVTERFEGFAPGTVVPTAMQFE